jgi:probable F420-dependent oxidoreductase
MGGIDPGRFGIRAWDFTDGDPGEAADAAAEVEALGFGALWIRAPAYFERAPALLEATSRLVVASSVFSLWGAPAEQLARSAAALEVRFPGRVLIGVGVSHRPLVERYTRPVASMNAYLDALDAAGLGADRRAIAALGPRMLEATRERALGTHPYLVTPEHSARARAALGPDALVAPAHVAVLGSPSRGREIGREHLTTPYTSLPNYRNIWLSLGFDEEDVHGSDRLVDGLIASGDASAVAARLREHLNAGASHVAVQLRGEDPFPRAAWRELAAALM